MPSPPPLARVLRCALLFRQPELDPARLPQELFAETAARCDAADEAYRAVIGEVLAPAAATEVLATTRAFRARVHEIRAAARAEADALLARNAHPPVDFDPLDVVSPRVGGLSHVDSVRLADLSDRARLQVGGLRAQANATIAPLLSDDARERLAAAKRARVVAFHGAVHAELAPLGPAVERFSLTVEGLAGVADGWY